MSRKRGLKPRLILTAGASASPYSSSESSSLKRTPGLAGRLTGRRGVGPGAGIPLTGGAGPGIGALMSLGVENGSLGSIAAMAGVNPVL